MSRGHKRGQSTLEYVLLVTAVVVVLIAFLLKSDSPFQKSLNTSLNSSLVGMEKQASYLNSR